MRVKYKFLTYGIAGILLSVSANNSAQAENLNEVMADWSGIYLGAQIGAGFSQLNHVHQNRPGTPATYETIRQNPAGVLGGVHVGYRKDFGYTVVGAELSYSKADLSQRTFIPATAGPWPPNPVWNRVRIMGIDDIVTATVQAGMKNGQFLFYGKAGYAGANVRTFGANVSVTPNIFGDVTRFEHGWTIGAGVDYQLSSNVSVGLDFSHIRITGRSRVIPCVNARCRVGFSNVNAQVNSVTGRLSYKF